MVVVVIRAVFLFGFPQYKYQVSVDGTVAAYRFPYLLLGDSLVMKQGSQYYEHFYVQLEPWVHYVPLERNLEDLLEKIKWAKVILNATTELSAFSTILLFLDVQ